MNYDVNVKVKKLIAKCWAEQMCIEGMTDGWVGVNSADGRGETVPYVGAGHWEGGLSWLHSADEGTVSWLTSYGSWHAYEKKKKTEKAKNWVLKFRYPNFVLLNRMRDDLQTSRCPLASPVNTYWLVGVANYFWLSLRIKLLNVVDKNKWWSGAEIDSEGDNCIWAQVFINLLLIITSDKGGGKCDRRRLSVCLLARSLKNASSLGLSWINSCCYCFVPSSVVHREWEIYRTCI